MKLASLLANRHVFEGRPNGRPLRFLLVFEAGRKLRLAGAGDGFRMLVDDQPIDEPFDMDECGSVGVEDMTDAMAMGGVTVLGIRSLDLDGARIGVRIDLADRDPFHFWIDDDENYWGDRAALAAHDWRDARAPSAGDPIPL